MTKVNKRGHNFLLPPDEVKSERYTVKFTKKEFERLENALKISGMERMEFSRQAILKFIANWENPLPSADIQRMTMVELSVRQKADILGYRNHFTPEEIAKRVGVPLNAVLSLMEQ